MLLCGYSPFRTDNTITLTQQNPDPKIEFQSLYWNLVSDQARSFIRRLAALNPLHRPTTDEALHNPWLATTNTPSHVDIAPTLRQNWNPRAKWRSAVTRVRAANRFAAASWSSTQSSGKWHEEQEEEDVMPGIFEPVRRGLWKM